MTKKISALPAVASIAGTEQLEVNQGGVSRRATATQLVAGADPAAHAPSHEAGGTDPITNLGALSGIGPISANVIIDAGGYLALNDGLIDRVALEPAGRVNVAAADGSAAVLESAALEFRDPSLAAVAALSPLHLMLGDGATTTVRAVLAGDGTGLVLNNASNVPQVSIDETGSLLDFNFLGNAAWNDGTENRVVIDSDGTGVTLYDDAGVEAGSVSEGVSDPTLLLRHKDATAVLRSLHELGDTFVTSQLFDAAGLLRLSDSIYDQGAEDFYWEVNAWADDGTTSMARAAVSADDGFDVTLADAAALPLSRMAILPSEFIVTVRDALGDVSNTINAYPTGMDINTFAAGGGFVVTAGISLAAGIAFTGDEGHFGITPYGQDAYLAPLNESVTIVLLTDVAALLDEERARINAINQYLIDRGWEAAA